MYTINDFVMWSENVFYLKEIDICVLISTENEYGVMSRGGVLVKRNFANVNDALDFINKEYITKH